MSPMFARIRWRLVAWTMLVVGLIVVALGVTVYVALLRSLLDQADRNLASRADDALANPRAFLGGPGELERERYRGGVFYLLIGPDGQLLANPQHVDTTDLDTARFLAADGAATTVDLDGETVRLFARQLQVVSRDRPQGRPPFAQGKPGPGGPAPDKPQGGPPPQGAALVVGQSLAPEERALRSLLTILIASVVGGLLAALGGAWFPAGRALVPIQHAFRRQQEFVADASHELRTPLTVLRSATDLLDRHRDEPLSANGELFDDVRADIARLQRLTGDLLTLARSDRGQLELATAPLDPAALAREVVRRVEPLAQERGIALGVEAAEGASTVEADPDRLQQVLLILLDNALKHTPAGGRVTIGVRPQPGHVVLEVADTGAGIPPEHLAKVFERFYRADAARTQGLAGEPGGTGLGLAIAKSLVEAHRGEIALASTPGQGTRVTVRLPAAPAHRSLPERLAARLTHSRQ